MLFPPSTTANGTIPSTPSISCCPNLEELVDMFFVQARCKFMDQFDETAKTMSRTMKNELSLRAEQERQRRAEWEGACTPTGTHDAVAMAAASAAQSTFLAAYYSGNSQNMAPPASVPPTTLISALATPGPFPVLTSALPSTFDAAIMAPDDQDPTVELTGQGLEIPGPNAVATATASPPATATVMPTAPPPAAAVTHVVARDVPDGGMTAKACDVTVIAASDATAAGATTTPGANPVAPFVARLSSAGRRSSLPVGGISRRRTSVPTGMPFTVFSESMPPPQSRTPFSTTKKVPTCFGATLLRSPLGEIRVNAAATCPSPTVNIVSAKKTAGGGGSADGGFGSSGGGGCSMGSSDTSKDNEIVWDGKRPASAISASPTKKGSGDSVKKLQSPGQCNGRVVTKRAKKVPPRSQRVLRSASRASRAATAATVATETPPKGSPQRPSTVKTAHSRTTRSATLR
eukprot:jgi/Undpi1/1603/HiC_scaffold_11.g04993.m1